MKLKSLLYKFDVSRLTCQPQAVRLIENTRVKSKCFILDFTRCIQEFS